MDTSKPLVSVFIVTYNSSDYIIEALESVRNQTYQNIELVVSDDCSSDDTLAKVKEWIDQNKGRFIRTEVVETPVNTGIPANYNRAVRACKGEWLKMMDGDDLILPNCVEDNVNYIAKHLDALVVFSDMFLFKETKGKKTMRKFFDEDKKIFFDKQSEYQLRWLLADNILPSQTCFIKAALLKDNSYDENYRLLEDYPMWVRLSLKGITFSYFDKCTAMYRLADSVSSNNKELFSSSYMVFSIKFNKEIVMPTIIEKGYSEAYDYNRKYNLFRDVCVNWLNNKKNRCTIILYYLIRFVIFHGMHFKLPSDK